MRFILLLAASFCAAAPKTPGARVDAAAPKALQAPAGALAAGVAANAAAPAPAPKSETAALPQLAAVAAPAQANRPGGAQARAALAFDGGHAGLDALASPWRTDRQLARLNAAPRKEGESFRFAVVGDAEEGRFWHSRKLFGKPGVFAEQLKSADAERADFIVQLGDIVSRGIPRHFRALFKMLQGLGLKTPLLTIPGNHDRHKPHGLSHLRLYERLFGRTDYVLDRGDWRFVFLDSSARRVTPEQLSWLDGRLDTDKRTVIFTHVPPGPLSRWTDWGPLKNAGGIGQGGAELLAVAARRGVEAVFLGHIHAFDTLVHRGVRYYLTGGGGSPLYPAPIKTRFHHYLLVEAGPDGLKVDVRKHPL